jgi:hypothetical protein
MLCPITPVPIQPMFVFPGAMLSDISVPHDLVQWSRKLTGSAVNFKAAEDKTRRHKDAKDHEQEEEASTVADDRADFVLLRVFLCDFVPSCRI